MAIEKFDVVVSGGGLSGLLTAIGLLRETPDLSIAIVEPVKQTNLSQPQVNFDGRCLALSYGSIQLLNHWGAWQELKQLAWPIKTIVTSDRGHAGKTIMKADDYELNAMGYVVEMRNLGMVLQNTLSHLEQEREKAQESGINITWFNPDTIESIEQERDKTYIALSSGKELCATLLIVAEGGASPTREKLGIECSVSSYPQSALIANVRTKGGEAKLNKLLARADQKYVDKVCHHVAFERFTTTGPVAFLPIGKQEYSLVWTETPERIESLLNLSNEALIQELQSSFGFAAGQVTSMSKPEVYPLSLIKAQQLFVGRSVLIGNSAHTVHPIAGQGFNLGLRDIAVLVNEIKQAHESNADIGDFSTLMAYSNNRVGDINRITGFTDILVRGFALEGRAPAAVRTLGLMALQKCDNLQQWLALHFMSRGSLKNIPQLKQMES